MTRNLALTLLCLAALAAVAAAQNVQTLQLPCESRAQELSPTGNQLAALCKDHSVYLVAIPSGSARAVSGTDRRVTNLVFSPNGHWLAIGFDDGTVSIISTTNTASVKQWSAGTRSIETLHFLADGKQLFVGPKDSPGTVWDVSAAPVLRATLTVDFGGIVACAISPDGKMLVAVGDDTVLRWYDTATWTKTAENRDFLLETFAVQFSPDGKYLLAGGADSRVTLLDASTGKQLRQLPLDPGSYIADIEMLGDQQRAATLYLDDAGNKPPHGAVWNLTTAQSAPLKIDPHPTWGGVVSGKLWLCTTSGNTLTISQYE